MESFVNDNRMDRSDSEDNSHQSEEGDVDDVIHKKRRATKKGKSSNTPVSSAKTERRKTSHVWSHFNETEDPTIVKCKYCEKPIVHKSSNGTSGMKNHITRCKMFPANIDRKQKLIDFESKTVVTGDGTVETVSVPKLWNVDQQSLRKSLAKMLIVDELPFIFVEREGFRDFCKDMCPPFVLPSRITVTRDCYSLYIEERNKLKDFFSKLSSRVCLTTDTWTSGQNLSYMCLTSHFIDDNWTLHKKILNFCPIPGHSSEVIGRHIEKCLNEWNVKKVLTITVDNASSNDVAVSYLKRRITHWGGSVMDGKYLHMRCAAHILNLVVKDGLKELDLSIAKIRGAVRFVRSSPARLEKFKACIEEENIESNSLVCLDVVTRWNSTYMMLESAVKFKNAFDNLYTKGGAYCKELRKHAGIPDDNDWKRVKVFLPFLQIFYEATLKMSGSLYVTGNNFVPQIYGGGFLISTYCEDEDEGIKKMAAQMKTKHDKYWANVDNINVLLFIALLLDPRHKWNFVEWVVKDTYDAENANALCSTIKVALKTIFEFYGNVVPRPKRKKDESSSATTSTPTSLHGVKCSEKKIDVQQLYFNRYQKESGNYGTFEKKSELEKYLNDEFEPSDPNFDILGWWSESQRRYPILARMARDVLAIPVSTAASESAFSTGGRVLDSFRSSLTPRIVESLICAQDCLRKSRGPLIIEENLLALEELENGMEDLTMQQPTIVVEESYALEEET